MGAGHNGAREPRTDAPRKELPIRSRMPPRKASAGDSPNSRLEKVIADIYAISNRDQLASSTIRDFFESWLKRKEIEATQKTHERYKTAMNHVLGFFGRQRPP